MFDNMIHIQSKIRHFCTLQRRESSQVLPCLFSKAQLQTCRKRKADIGSRIVLENWWTLVVSWWRCGSYGRWESWWCCNREHRHWGNIVVVSIYLPCPVWKPRWRNCLDSLMMICCHFLPWKSLIRMCFTQQNGLIRNPLSWILMSNFIDLNFVFYAWLSDLIFSTLIVRL